MAAPSYIVFNSAQPTTAAPVAQPSGNTIRTMMQLRFALGIQARLMAFGISGDASTALAPGKVELFETTVAATMSTAYAAADIQPYSPGNALANTAGATGTPLNLSTATSGFATAAVTEGTVANYRSAWVGQLAPDRSFDYQWPLGREFEVNPQNYLRLRVTFAATVNLIAYMVFEV
jgi:hypothetical protein